MNKTPIFSYFSYFILFLVSTLIFILVPSTCYCSQTPWEEDSFFTSKAGDILKAVQEASGSTKDNAAILLDEGVFSFDISGRLTYRYRLVYRLLNQTSVSNWSTVSAVWSPWHEEKPSIRARVITPDGAVHVLQPDVITDSPVRQDSDLTFHDRRTLRAPLPALMVGAIVEEEIVTRETRPFFSAGSLYRFTFGQSDSGTIKTRLILEAPVSLPLRHMSKLMPDVVPIQYIQNDVRRVIYEASNLKPLQSVEAGMPTNLPRWPNVAFSTGKTWGDIALEYSKQVDKSIAATDLTKLVKEIIGSAIDPHDVASRLLEFVRNEIRYTGLELGESSIMPRSPVDTLRLKYGDCKDQSTLLVSLLRSAGLPAYVALLNNGTGADLDENLPGFGAFNHAIVYVSGPEPLWIDPVESFLTLGELPSYDQGRLALIASSSTTALVKTQESSSKSNRKVQTREFILQETGPARVFETTDMWGSFAALYRNTFESNSETDLKKMLEKYVFPAYRTNSMGAYTSSPRLDRSTPFKLRIEIPASESGQTDDTDAAVAVVSNSVFSRLPEILTTKSSVPRQYDYLLQEPYVSELRYRIVPPEGYRAKLLPKSQTIEIGPMMFSRDFHLESNGEVSVLIKFDTGPRNISATQFNAAREGLLKLTAEDPIVVEFEQYGFVLMTSGRLKEAIAEFRRLALLHPGESMHHIQISKALLAAGLGGQAIKAAEMAVSLDPRSVKARRTLAWMLQHDPIGRLRSKGYDRVRAITEYRTALDLDPKDYLSRANLAILLEHNSSGDRYSRDSDMSGAISEYYVVRNDLKNSGMDINLLECLFHSERWQELKDVSLAMEDSDTRNEFYLTAVAMLDGVNAALKDANQLIGDRATRRKVFETIGEKLVQLRCYPEASKMLAEAANGRVNSAALTSRSSLMKKVKRFESLQMDPSQPTTVLKQMLMAVMQPRSAQVPFISLFAQSLQDAMKTERSEVEYSEIFSNYFESLMKSKDKQVSNAVTLDILLSQSVYGVEGNDTVGYRITASSALSEDIPAERVIVTKENSHYRIVATSSQPELAGVEILHLLEEGKYDSARTILNWIRSEVNETKDDDVLPSLPFRYLWPKDGKLGTENMRLAAVALLAKMDGTRAIPILKSYREKTHTGFNKPALDVALLQAYYYSKMYSSVLKMVGELEPNYPRSELLLRYRLMALRDMERWDLVKELVLQKLQEKQGDQNLIRLLATSYEQTGDFDNAELIYRKLIDEGSNRAVDFNNLAWICLFRSPLQTDSLSYAERAVALSKGENWAYLHTLAAVYAESGKTNEARETILKAMSISGRDELSSSDWFVFGLIAEKYGEMQAGREAYSNMKESDPDNNKANSSYALMKVKITNRQLNVN